jgi:hypothetical protein
MGRFVELGFFDVVGYGGVHEFAERLSGGDGFANCGCGDSLMDAVEQVYGRSVQHQIAPGWLLFKRLGDVCGGT